MGYYNGKILHSLSGRELPELDDLMNICVKISDKYNLLFCRTVDVTPKMYIISFRDHNHCTKGMSFLMNLGIKYNLAYGNSDWKGNYIQLHIPKKSIETIVSLFKLKLGI